MPARVFLWVLLSAPLALETYRFLVGTSFYGEYLHFTGDQSARLLIGTLAITPLNLAFPKAGWLRWLLLQRRDIGLVTFLYAFAHVIVYLVNENDFATIVEEAMSPGLWTGWIAFLIFIPLAVTSNNASVRALGQRWKRLHQAVYLAAVLTFVHWILTAFDPTAGIVHFAVLIAILLARLWLVRRRQRPA